MKSGQAIKPPVVASAVEKGGNRSEDEAEALLASPPKTSLLPTGLSRSIVIGAILFVISTGTVGLLGNRYTLVPPTGAGNNFIYRVDRLTGSVAFCSPAKCSPLPMQLDQKP
jgi:hypothetical protein